MRLVNLFSKYFCAKRRYSFGIFAEIYYVLSIKCNHFAVKITYGCVYITLWSFRRLVAKVILNSTSFSRLFLLLKILERKFL